MTNIRCNSIKSKELERQHTEKDKLSDNNNKEFVALNATFGTYDTVHLWSPIAPKDINLQALNTTLNANREHIKSHLITEHNGTTVGINYDAYKERVLVTVPSLPKILAKDKYTLYPHEVTTAINTLTDVISPYLTLNAPSAIISRLDSSTAFEMRHEVGTYIDLLYNCTTDKRGHAKKHDYSRQTVAFRNKSIEVGFYDKGAKEHIQTDTLLRFEAKYKNSSTVAKDLTAQKRLYLSDLSSGHIMKHAVQKRAREAYRYFQIDKERAMSYQTQLAFMTAMKQNGKRNAAVDTALYMLLQSDEKAISTILALMTQVGYSRDQKRRVANKMNEIKASAPNVKDLYAELLDHIQSELNEASQL